MRFPSRLFAFSLVPAFAFVSELPKVPLPEKPVEVFVALEAEGGGLSVGGIDLKTQQALAVADQLAQLFGGVPKAEGYWGPIYDFPGQAAAQAFIAEVERMRAGVAYANVVQEYRTFGDPNDPYWDEQCDMEKIEVEEAWPFLPYYPKPIKVAIIDTGVRTTHEDLKDKVVASGPNFTSEGAGDNHGHGTHVAGICAAVKDNGKGIAGVAPNAKILPVKVLSPASRRPSRFP